MTVLTNPKHERFAQFLAKGKTADEAYVEAGYKQNRHNAATLGRSQHISTRVAAIQAKAAERTEVTVAGLTARLLAIATKCETSADAPLLSVARASIMDAAKLNGLVVEKLDAKVASRPVEATDDELAAIAFGRSDGTAEATGRAH